MFRRLTEDHGSQNIRESSIYTLSLEQLRGLGAITAAQEAIESMEKKQLDGFWIHLDADVLDDAIMPAVDYRLAGGLQWDELTELLKLLMASHQATGITITIFNPKLDPDGLIAEKFVHSISAGLQPSGG